MFPPSQDPRRGWSARWRASTGLIVLLGCSDPGDFQRDGDAWRYRGQVIEGADTRTFRVLDAHHARDARQVWWADTERKAQDFFLTRHVSVRRIEGADAGSFVLLRHGYARDRNAVYHEGRAFPVADVAGFEPLDDGFARDGRHGYYQRQPIPGSAGAPGFRVLDSWHADDGQRIFHARLDDTSGRPRVQALSGVDRGSFAVLGAHWARDSRTLFFAGTRLPDDPASFRALDRGYVRTATQVYHLGRSIAGADAASFEVLASTADDDGADARDARRRYGQGKAIER